MARNFAVENISGRLLEEFRDSYFVNLSRNEISFSDDVINLLKKVNGNLRLEIQDNYSCRFNKDMIINEVMNFSRHLGINSEDILKELLRRKKIRIKQINCQLFDNAKCNPDENLNKDSIYVRSHDNINGIYFLAHELGHSINFKLDNSKIVTPATELTGEVVPLFIEFLLIDYYQNSRLFEHMIREGRRRFNNLQKDTAMCLNKLNLFPYFSGGNIHITIEEFKSRFKHLSLEEQNILLLSNYGRKTYYIYSYYLAFELFLQYKNNPERTINTIKEFIINSPYMSLNEMIDLLNAKDMGNENSKQKLMSILKKDN